MAVVLIGWAGWCLSLAPVAAAVAGTEPLQAAGPPAPIARGFDRAALQAELSRPLGPLQAQPEALRDHVQRLGDLQFALELAVDVTPEERRVLNERILTRVGEVGLLRHQRTADLRDPGKGRGVALDDGAWLPAAGDLPGLFLENSGLLVRLLGGLLVAVSLGYLAVSRRAARSSSSGSRGGRRLP